MALSDNGFPLTLSDMGLALTQSNMCFFINVFWYLEFHYPYLTLSFPIYILSDMGLFINPIWLDKSTDSGHDKRIKWSPKKYILKLNQMFLPPRPLADKSIYFWFIDMRSWLIVWNIMLSILKLRVPTEISECVGGNAPG